MKISDLTETHILGPKTRQMVVRVDAADPRPWLQHAPVCGALAQHRIAHLGVCEAHSPYCIVRMKQSGTYFLSCQEGEGQLLVDGRWQSCKAGMACLLPPHMLNAFRCLPGKPWRFVWVRYQSVPEKRPIARAASPVMARFHGEPLRAAMLGLHAECSGPEAPTPPASKNSALDARSAAPAVVHHWVELIQTYVLRFAHPWEMDARLAALWEKVAGRLQENWTLDRLAQVSHMSGEHLRRLCTEQLGRSPMRQVTYLRMRQAAHWLSTTDDKIETIARSLGYQNPFVFSTTFKKWIGWRPSEHRMRSAHK